MSKDEGKIPEMNKSVYFAVVIMIMIMISVFILLESFRLYKVIYIIGNLQL